jgi:hypothetical protein
MDSAEVDPFPSSLENPEKEKKREDCRQEGKSSAGTMGLEATLGEEQRNNTSVLS